MGLWWNKRTREWENTGTQKDLMDFKKDRKDKYSEGENGR